MKKINFLLITLFLTTSCGSFKEAGKVLRNEKQSSTDEFLVKKREPLILPPEYDKIPEPNSDTKSEKEKNDENKIQEILKTSKENSSSKSTSSTEESILNKIKK